MKHGLQVLDDYQKYGYVVGAFGGSPLSPPGGGIAGQPWQPKRRISEKLLEEASRDLTLSYHSYLKLGSTVFNHQACLPLHLKPGLGVLIFQTLNEDAGFAKYHIVFYAIYRYYIIYCYDGFLI